MVRNNSSGGLQMRVWLVNQSDASVRHGLLNVKRPQAAGGAAPSLLIPNKASTVYRSDLPRIFNPSPFSFDDNAKGTSFGTQGRVDWHFYYIAAVSGERQD